MLQIMKIDTLNINALAAKQPLLTSKWINMRQLIIIISYFFLLTSCARNKMAIQLENYMDAQAEINSFSGTVLVTKNDSVLLKKAYGFADYEWEIENTIDTKFSLASISKQFTAVAILQLAEDNKLSLDDKLSKYYPDFPSGDLITIKMLLTHNSGISNDFDELFLSNTKLSSDSVVNYIMTKPLLFEPSSQTAYSNTAYYLLTTLIEKVSETSFATYLEQHIFKKSKMSNSGVSSNDSIYTKMSRAYYRKNDTLIQNPYINWSYNIGLDGIYSTVDDLYLWNKHLFEDTTLLSEKTKTQMFTSYNEHDFGYGVLVNPFYNHNHNMIGHDGGFYGVQTSLNKFIDDDVFVTVLSNNGSPSYLITYGLAAIIFGIPVELPYKHIAISVDSKIYDEYVGEYEGVKIHKKDGKLFYSDYNIELIPESKTKFFRSDNNDRTIEFVKNEKGEVTQIIMMKAGVKELKHK